ARRPAAGAAREPSAGGRLWRRGVRLLPRTAGCDRDHARGGGRRRVAHTACARRSGRAARHAREAGAGRRAPNRRSRMTFDVAHGDITEQHVDAIVNAPNSSLLGGGGVDGAIHRRGGPDILAACRALRAGDLRDGLATGDAVATTAGRLPARWVIHTVGPVHATSEDHSHFLRSCYRRSLEV